MAADDADHQPDAELTITTLDNVRLVNKAEQSTQLDDHRIQGRAGIGLRPPYNPDRLAAFLELNETHAVAVRKKSRYEVGYGFDVVPAEGLEEDGADPLQRALIENFWRSRESRWQTGPADRAEPTSPTEVKELARQDYHAIGWLCLEILTDSMGRPVGLAHVPANTVRVRKAEGDDPGRLDARGYVQVRRGRRRYFGEAGDRYRGLQTVITDRSGGAGNQYAFDTVVYEGDTFPD